MDKALTYLVHVFFGCTPQGVELINAFFKNLPKISHSTIWIDIPHEFLTVFVRLYGVFNSHIKQFF